MLMLLSASGMSDYCECNCAFKNLTYYFKLVDAEKNLLCKIVTKLGILENSKIGQLCI